MDHVCDECGEKFNSGVVLGGHKAGAHSENVVCEYCGEEFNKPRIKEHQNSCPYNPKNKTYCKECGDLLTEKTQNKFCSESCSVSYSNKRRELTEDHKSKISNSLRSDDKDYGLANCRMCGNNLDANHKEFCSRKCRKNFLREERFSVIKKTGKANFDVKCYTNANWIKRYYIHKHGEKCMKCGWDEKNPHTGNVPIELDHIDGDHKNNTLENTRLLCPNCHSLTKNYKGANLGNGRSYRKKYS